MKLSLGRVSLAALAFGSLLAAGTPACAGSEPEPFGPTPAEASDSGLPEGDGAAASDAAPDAPVEAGPRACSVHGFCPTSLPGKQTLQAVWGDGAGVAWAIASKGDVLRWDGNTWKVHTSGLGRLTAIWGTGPTDVWIGGDTGIQHGTGTSSADLTFAPSELPVSAPAISSIWGASASDVWAIAREDDPFTGLVVASVLRFDGAEWTLEPSVPPDITYSRVWGSAGSGVWLAGTRPDPETYLDALVIVRRLGDGDFVEYDLPRTTDVDPIDALPTVLDGAVAIGDAAVWLFGATFTEWPTVWHGTSSDNGATFTFTVHPGVPGAPRLTSVSGTDPTNVLAAGEYGRVRRWNGSSWLPVAVTTTTRPVVDRFYGVWSRGSSEAWLVGEDIALRYDPTQARDGGLP
ncbi:MAG: hypothetical protein KF901_32565 [Myxococcales bacterium]|nr:hypothetical protein [Myxococcales bacterium]